MFCIGLYRLALAYKKAPHLFSLSRLSPVGLGAFRLSYNAYVQHTDGTSEGSLRAGARDQCHQCCRKCRLYSAFDSICIFSIRPQISSEDRVIVSDRHTDDIAAGGLRSAELRTTLMALRSVSCHCRRRRFRWSATFLCDELRLLMFLSLLASTSSLPVLSKTQTAVVRPYE